MDAVLKKTLQKKSECKSQRRYCELCCDSQMLRAVIPHDTTETACLPDLLMTVTMMMMTMIMPLDQMGLELKRVHFVQSIFKDITAPRVIHVNKFFTELHLKSFFITKPNCQNLL